MARGLDYFSKPPRQRREMEAGSSAPAGQGRAIKQDTRPGKDLRLPVKRKMVGVLGHQHLRDAAPGTPLHAVLRELLASEFGTSSWLMTYWSKPVLFSVDARRSWVALDLKPLPF
jgi:hypothetical protein